jgi:hypothetical protein
MSDLPCSRYSRAGVTWPTRIPRVADVLLYLVSPAVRWNETVFSTSVVVDREQRLEVPELAPHRATGRGLGFIGNSPSRCSFLRASLRARRRASAFSRARFSEGFS